jgi:hypothetical protein
LLYAQGSIKPAHENVCAPSLPTTLAGREDFRRICVRDANRQALPFVYGRATESDGMQAKVLTDDEARRVAANIARLPELRGRGK